MTNKNDDTPKIDSDMTEHAQVSQKNYDSSKSQNYNKDFDSPYSIYMSNPTNQINKFGVGTGSYGNQNYGFQPSNNQYPQEHDQAQQVYQAQQSKNL